MIGSFPSNQNCPHPSSMTEIDCNERVWITARRHLGIDKFEYLAQFSNGMTKWVAKDSSELTNVNKYDPFYLLTRAPVSDFKIYYQKNPSKVINGIGASLSRPSLPKIEKKLHQSMKFDMSSKLPCFPPNVKTVLIDAQYYTEKFESMFKYDPIVEREYDLYRLILDFHRWYEGYCKKMNITTCHEVILLNKPKTGSKKYTNTLSRLQLFPKYQNIAEYLKAEVSSKDYGETMVVTSNRSFQEALDAAKIIYCSCENYFEAALECCLYHRDPKIVSSAYTLIAYLKRREADKSKVSGAQSPAFIREPEKQPEKLPAFRSIRVVLTDMISKDDVLSFCLSLTQKISAWRRGLDNTVIVQYVDPADAALAYKILLRDGIGRNTCIVKPDDFESGGPTDRPKTPSRNDYEAPRTPRGTEYDRPRSERVENRPRSERVENVRYESQRVEPPRLMERVENVRYDRPRSERRESFESVREIPEKKSVTFGNDRDDIVPRDDSSSRRHVSDDFGLDRVPPPISSRNSGSGFYDASQDSGRRSNEYDRNDQHNTRDYERNDRDYERRDDRGGRGGFNSGRDSDRSADRSDRRDSGRDYNRRDDRSFNGREDYQDRKSNRRDDDDQSYKKSKYDDRRN
jgi:hypothetical protein